MAIYFDNSATTRPFDFVAERVQSVMLETFYNPSALYAPALTIARDIQSVRVSIANDLRVREDEILFTSGGTESNNAAVLGVALSLRHTSHFITTGIEHASVYELFRYLEHSGHTVTYLPCDGNGVVTKSILLQALKPDTAMVSIMHVNNEIGSVMDIAELAKEVKQRAPHCVFHVDGVQAYPKIITDMSNVDLYSISGHKFHAPRGVGVLVSKKKLKLQPLFSGGGQEFGLRSGTENTPGILGLGAAQQYYAAYRDQILDQLASVKYRLVEGLSQIEGIRINGPEMAMAAPHILSVSFAGIQGEALVHALEQKEIYVGTGSACSSHKKGANRILTGMGVPSNMAAGTIRLSFGCFNTPEESDIVAQEIAQAVSYLRRFKRR